MIGHICLETGSNGIVVKLFNEVGDQFQGSFHPTQDYTEALKRALANYEENRHGTRTN
jgi:hypothetical protein